MLINTFQDSFCKISKKTHYILRAFISLIIPDNCLNYDLDLTHPYFDRHC